MNWFVLFNGVTYCGAAVYSATQGHWAWAGVWLFYGLSAMLLAGLEGH